MTITFQAFVSGLAENPTLLVTVILTLAVVLVNGWTDAPNAIATCVSTRSLAPRPAVFLAAVCNFLGALSMTLLNARVAETIYSLADFSGSPKMALTALCAGLLAIVIWATCAWWFGIPTSESHALIAAISGAAIALQGTTAAISEEAWSKVLKGLGISVAMGFLLGFGVVRMVAAMCRGLHRRRADRFFRGAQRLGSAAMAYLHGAQDGQKFMGVFLLGVFLAQGQETDGTFVIPLWLTVLCSLVMALGTSVGGGRIIKAVGMDMVKLRPYEGFSADLAASASLLLSTWLGIPVSTTHVKTTAVMGVGAAKGRRAVNWRVAGEMVLAWVFTFPGCGGIGYGLAKLFMSLL